MMQKRLSQKVTRDSPGMLFLLLTFKGYRNIIKADNILDVVGGELKLIIVLFHVGTGNVFFHGLGLLLRRRRNILRAVIVAVGNPIFLIFWAAHVERHTVSVIMYVILQCDVDGIAFCG